MQDAFTQPLPVHPTMRHPRTGLALRAVGIVGGKPVWPILGASPDDPDDGGDGGNGGNGGNGGDTGGKSGDGRDGGDGGSGSDKDLGFPKDTAVAEMTAEQQAAYWRHQAQKHEGRAKGLSKVIGGKTAEQLKAEAEELEKFRGNTRTETEKAVKAAEEKVRAEERAKSSERLARAALSGALSHLEKEQRDDIIADANLARFIDDDGEVNHDRVKAYVARNAQAGKADEKRKRDWGGGSRSDSADKKAGSAGKTEAQRRFGDRTKKDNQ